MADDAKKSCSHVDEVRIGPELGDGGRLFVRHTAEHKTVAGVMRRMNEGEPLLDGAGIFALEPKDPANGVFKATDLVSPRSGPAQVATDEYRTSWDRTFGGHKQPVGEA